MYTPEEVAEAKKIILDKVAQGSSLEAVIRDDLDMRLPKRTTVYGWMQEGHSKYDAVFTNDYARAYELRASKMFEDNIDIADAAPATKEGIAKAKLRIETRQWNLARMNSKRFGNKVETTLQGGDKPIETIDYSKLSPEALEEIAKQSNAGKT